MSKHIRANDMTDEERESETPEQRAWRMAMRENPMVARTDAEMKRLMALPIEEREAMAKEMMAGCKPQHMVADEEAARLAKPSEPEPVDDTPEVAKGIERAIEAGQPPSDDQHMLIEALQAIQAQLQQPLQMLEDRLQGSLDPRAIGLCLEARNLLRKHSKLNGSKGH